MSRSDAPHQRIVETEELQMKPWYDGIAWRIDAGSSCVAYCTSELAAIAAARLLSLSDGTEDSKLTPDVSSSIQAEKKFVEVERKTVESEGESLRRWHSELDTTLERWRRKILQDSDY